MDDTWSWYHLVDVQLLASHVGASFLELLLTIFADYSIYLVVKQTWKLFFHRL